MKFDYMCRETEKLIKILNGGNNPTDMALIILANKLDDLSNKVDLSIKSTDDKCEEITLATEKKFIKLREEIKFAKWLETNKRIIRIAASVIIVLSIYGLSGLVSYIKTKLGIQ